MNLQQGQTYWIEHAEHGTVQAELRLLSPNQQSLLFILPHLIALHYGGGVGITEFLALSQVDGRFTELHTGEGWQIYQQEPAIKLPTS